MQFRAPGVEVEGLVSAASVDFFGEQSLDVRGDIVAPSGTIRLGSGSSGSTYLAGTLDVSAAARSDRAGGHVEIVGQTITLDAAQILATGNGGGQVLIGGGPQGSGLMPPADRTDIIHYSVIDASGADAGNGGRVIVWSELDTRISQTTIRARGGEFGGDGGMIETSGHLGLLVTPTAQVDAGSPAGEAGTWLLDPRNVSIKDMTTSGGTFDGGDPDTFVPTADDAVVNRGSIQTSLNSGTSVVITTGTTGGQAGNITVVDSITRSAGSGTPSLTLMAAGFIDVHAPVSGSTGFGLDVILNAGANVIIMSPVDTFGGSFSSTGVDFSGNAAISADTIDIDMSGDVTISDDLTATTSISVHAGNDGTGNLAFGGSPKLSSTTISLRAGNSAATPTANINVAGATFLGTGAGTSPVNFMLEQDVNVADADLPTVTGPNQFGAGVPVNYTIQSDRGTVMLTDADLVGSGASATSTWC